MNVVTLRTRHVLSLLRLKELRPRTYQQERTTVARDILHAHELIMLRGVGTHLQPQHVVGVLSMTVAQDNIPVVQRLAA